MSLVNKIGSGMSSCSQSEKSNNVQNGSSSTKKQIVTMREGDYYCTYMIDENGQKILLNKIPLTQVEEQKENQFSKAGIGKSFDYNAGNNARMAFECQQQLRLETSHRKNLQETMNLLEESVGIPNQEK